MSSLAPQLNVNSVELLNDAGSEYTAGTKLHFKIRLKAKDYKGELVAGDWVGTSS